MLVNLNGVLPQAKAQRYGVGLFNTVTLEMAKGVIAAAEETGSPVIVGTAEVLLPCGGDLRDVAAMVLPLAKAASVPVVLHYDHGLTEARIKEAIRLGFTSVMYDCSTLPYEENVAAVKQMVDYAHARGVTVEGELGHVGSNVSGADNTVYTDPDQARDYVLRTGVDALAVAIGTAHGPYKETPKLALDVLKAIADKVDVPLVLHGGSGLSDDDFRHCIQNGIAKVNIFTDINRAAAKAAHDAYTDGCGSTDLFCTVTKAVQEATKEKMALFDSARWSR